MSQRYFLAAAVCAGFWAAVGLLLGACGRHPLGGLIGGLLLGFAYIVACGWASDKFPGDAWDAKLLENSSAPNLYEMLHSLCARTGQPLPTLYYIPRSEPNAFVSAGRDGETAIYVTSGLTRSLEKDEVQATLALMIARLATGAMPGWTSVATLAGAPLSIGLSQIRQGRQGLGAALLSVFAFPSAALVRMVWNEKTITAADYHAAHLAEQPGSLARALAKIEAGVSAASTSASSAEENEMQIGNPATALLFAVPPVPPPSPGGEPLWHRGFAAFPSHVPDAAVRASRFSEVVPSYVPEPVEEFHIY